MTDLSKDLQITVTECHANSQSLDLQCGNSKAFLFPERQGQICDLSGHRGIVDYEPNELVLTVRSGTPLSDIDDLLNQHNQMLAFEPPYYGPHASIGGSLACNLSGPRRPFVGALRDFVLGIKLLDGTGNIHNLGARVIKNVAGYDVSRLNCGAYGHLGIVLEISFKLLPMPLTEFTLVKKMQIDEALWTMTQVQNKPWPLSALCHVGQTLYLRINGSEKIAKDIAYELGAELYSDSTFWYKLKEQQLEFFKARNDYSLWRISCPPAYSHIHHVSDECLLDWGGALRWFWCADSKSEEINSIMQETGIFAMQYRGQQKFVFPPLGPLLPLHKKLKTTFDPQGIFNPGKAFAF